MSHNDLMGFQFFGVDRTVPTRPITLRSIWIGHFAFFDLCYGICRCRVDGERAGRMQHDSTMSYLERNRINAEKKIVKGLNVPIRPTYTRPSSSRFQFFFRRGERTSKANIIGLSIHIRNRSNIIIKSNSSNDGSSNLTLVRKISLAAQAKM